MRQVLFALLAFAGLAAAPAQAAPAGWYLELYDGHDFRGESRRYQNGWGDLSKDGFNDRALSVRARGLWQVCEHASLGGRCARIDGDVADLERLGLGRTISSLQLLSGTPGAGRGPYDGDLAGGPGYGAPGYGGGGRWGEGDWGGPEAPAAEGRTAAFFPRPRFGADCGGDRRCAAEAAAAFCGRQGFRDAAYFSVSGGRRGRGGGLEDVLCVR